MNYSKQQIATFLAILFHVSGVIGILFSPYRHWFIQNTPFNLCLMGILLLWTQSKNNSSFYLFCAIAYLTGMGVEMIGVNTGRLFGHYQYGTVLGARINGVPWIIGLNWLMVVYGSGSFMIQLQQWFQHKLMKTGNPIPARITAVSMIIDGALIAMFFDWVMEPVAMKLGFWQWQNSEIPLYNYLCWFVISALLLMVYRWLDFERPNHFAVHLLIIQLLFFLTLRTYL